MVYNKDNMDINEKGGKQETMKEVTTTIKKYVEECPICKKQFWNNSPSAVKYNLELHLRKHTKESALIKNDKD